MGGKTLKADPGLQTQLAREAGAVTGPARRLPSQQQWRPKYRLMYTERAFCHLFPEIEH